MIKDNWIMNNDKMEVARLIPFKRKIRLRRKRKYIIKYIVIFNPYFDEITLEKLRELKGSDKE